MRIGYLIAALIAGLLSAGVSEAQPYHVGIARITVAADAPFDALIWYPTQAEEVPWRAGPFLGPATLNAAIASGRFPIVLLSHGGGLTGGSPLILRTLSADLARQGFVVVAPFHGKTRLSARPLQVRMALDAMLADTSFASHVDPTRLGMLGFSLGTTVTLELAGAIPNMAIFVAYCSAHPTDALSCQHAPGGGGTDTAPQPNLAPGATRLVAPLPLKAIALLDPFAVMFQHDELAAVTMPVLLFRPQQSELPGEANAFGLMSALPHPSQVQIVRGGHFIFADVCTQAQQAAAPEVCGDPPGVDRASVLNAVEVQLAKFFHDTL